jgi:hypothetical protein
MSVIDLLRKGFGYVLLSMGVSRPAARPKSKLTSDSGVEPAPKPDDSSGGQSSGGNRNS